MKKLSIEQMENVNGGSCLTTFMAYGVAWSAFASQPNSLNAAVLSIAETALVEDCYGPYIF